MGASGSITATPTGKLNKAIKKGNLEAAKKAIEEGADINSAFHIPPLILAVWHDQPLLVEYLAKLREPSDEDGNLGKVLIDRDQRDSKLVNGGTACHAASGRNNAPMLRLLYDYDFKDYGKNDDNQIPYEVIGKYATGARKGKGAAYKELCVYFDGRLGRVSFSSVSSDPCIELQKAIKKGDLEAVKQSVSAGTDVTKPSPVPPIILAVWHGHVAIVDFLSKLREPVDEDGNLGAFLINRDTRDETLVHGGNACCAAAGRNDVEMLKWLVGNGFSEYDRDGDSHSPYELIGKYATGIRKGKGEAYQELATFFDERRGGYGRVAK